MKIAMIGSGAAGSVFAAYLKKGGADDITLVDRYKAHMDKIAESGLVMKDPTGEYHLEGFKTAYSAEDIGIMDVVVLMVKATQTDSAMKSAMKCIGPDTVVVTLQNGLGNDERLKKYVPGNRLIFGCGNMGTELPEPGKCVSKPFPGNNMFFGPAEKCGRTDAVGKYIEECFTKGGLSPRYYDDVRPYVWRKATSNSGFNTTCAILRSKVRYVAADENGMALVWQIWREAADVAEALGIPGIWEYMQEQFPSILASIGDYYPSMAQDVVLNQRETEVTCLTGAISDYGKKVGVPTPTCDVLTQVVKYLEANYENMYKGE
ncbi:MAG TPA: 2-dehydropantoate 2-reductase [Oscillospiraceae bacterium]|nr:2-dehydropantoate 2-reductase [Oscillospiraceae bacterium]